MGGGGGVGMGEGGGGGWGVVVKVLGVWGVEGRAKKVVGEGCSISMNLRKKLRGGGGRERT